jgi:hypothetical protein
MNALTISEIESAIEHTINALGLAKLALSKSALPAFSESDVLRKSDLIDTLPRASLTGDAITKAATAALADLNRRLDKLEAGRDLDNQTRKTWAIS